MALCSVGQSLWDEICARDVGPVSWPANATDLLCLFSPSPYHLQEELGLEPADESSKAYLLFHVPKDREARLPAFLQRLDATRQQVGGQEGW